MEFFIFTSGCKANQWDSHVIADRLEEDGFSRGPLGSSDIVIVNACSLTGRAETDTRRFIQKARSTNEKAKIVLVGCQAQAYGDRSFGADLVLGQEEKFEARHYRMARGRLVRQTREFAIEAGAVGALQPGRTRFFFKIQDGCNKFCSYCIVPYARGAARSRPTGDILKTMKGLEAAGVKEVVLTGIDMAAYHDPLSGMGLSALLGLLETSRTPPRIRLSSVDPEYIDDEFVSLMAGSQKIVPSIHMPVQSGSDAVLKRMGRRHGRDFISRTVEKLTAAIDGVGIGMDVMVGFPGEDEGAFRETYSLIQGLDICYLHIFPFSPREGTRAAQMDGRVPEKVKSERVRTLKALDREKREAFARRFVGKRVRVVPEGKYHPEGLMKGFSENYLAVFVPYEKRLENSIVEVTIMGVHDGKAKGRIEWTCFGT